ncbi:MAG: hypothetical protein UR25_C0005G0006 [Candidatus Nomurabacteria bacterium GW2011_GWE1_32_28]|uniref:Prepilin-type N-terminal cleavage/methylation domain-containing protein n=1 Tax=Candidatus Nomurabacteria bacterium GW2011_GWF1_31_48 TaxID=1618767 RepID=A0A0F9YF29_9BACT|nr:MAG: hypothetical protein UR10_C0003G0204 [Candidatus Nomurabacteria bacterium GW2011_GWF2_30_133]KKP28423.1 MAG: hypothetical protein UR18_C0004G0005 [Candidatus Nomurabacteria bacterium GW2011_GWE2_31_40]KKP30003.1 MAG: hypothetical protein UR19_C0005G0005 [Candidatus Nomurabacteria bacterium GW2011_GWF1_31_48]KKP34522.1 MAG: hypothetical protein UR25_C0005G0006 [Candidatus Nomurabacteria bacterium GW2011_GWE1_32_28]HAS81079.1 hypothetical protein [Candidatus Nomurabacteria bacterium]
MKNFKKISGGFMMVEVIVAISIIVVSVLAAMSVTQKSIFVSRQALHVKEASFLLEEGAESMRIIRDNSWNNISTLNIGTDYYFTFSGGTWTLSNIPSTTGIFVRKVNISNVNRNVSTDDIESLGIDDPGTKLITITVSWIDGGETLSKTLSFYIMDIFSE